MHLLSLVKQCDRSQFESTVILSPGSSLKGAIEETGTRVVEFGIDARGALLQNLRALRQLCQFLRRERVDIVHTHTSVAAALGRIAARWTGVGVTVHMMHNFGSHDGLPWPKRMIYRLVEWGLDPLTDLYITGSHAMVEQGLKKRIFRPGKVRCIYYGVDTASLAEQAAAHADSIRQEVSAPPDTVLVGFLGRLEPQKGCDVLLQAAALVREQNPRVRFLVAGEGSLRPSLNELSARLRLENTVTFLGWRSNVAGFLSGLDLLAMPSNWEPFGLSAAEAMSLRLPVIATAVDGLPEVLGDTGLLIPPRDPQALAAAVLELAADPERRRSMGERGRSRVEDLYSERRMVEAHERLYLQLVGRSTPPVQSALSAETAS